MGDITGFLKIKRKDAGNRPVNERIFDYSEIEQTLNSEDRMLQASRCMDCGIPFCQWSCPVDNLIPEWNDILYRGDWKTALSLLEATNNFPEFTGRICPAPCEHSCVLNLGFEPVTIRENEVAIVERAFSEGYIKPNPPHSRSGKNIAIIGSGPAGLAAADQLNRNGHNVTVFEKNDKVGGLLRYGIPDFKMRKAIIDRRLEILLKEGITISTGIEVGKDISAGDLLKSYDALCITIGASHPRDLEIPGRDLNGIHFAVDYLTAQNRVNAGIMSQADNKLNAEGKRVLVIGGGDTGSDCIGTAIRQRALSVIQIEIMPEPPASRTIHNPWPYYARLLKTSTSHEEGCSRLWSISVRNFTGTDGIVNGIEAEDVKWNGENGKMSMTISEGSLRKIETDFILLALGFLHPVQHGIISELGLELDQNKNINTDIEYRTSCHKVFAAGDAVTGASLVVRAIVSGRKAAAAINVFLTKD